MHTKKREMSRVLRGAKIMARALAQMSRKAADVRSFLRFAADLFLFGVMRSRRLPWANREREIWLRGDIHLTYRLNRGDIACILEIWLDESYRLPFQPPAPNFLIDLGANIGLTSVWLVKHYGYSTLIAVEPSPSNARLARINLQNNGIAAQVIESAIGPTDGEAFFEDYEASNLGRLSSKGRRVSMISMQSVLRNIPDSFPVSLLKLDIEGGEEDLLQGDVRWLDRVQAIIVEFHPSIMDSARAIKTLQEAGFNYIPAGSVHPRSMDAFIRHSSGFLKS